MTNSLDMTQLFDLVKQLDSQKNGQEFLLGDVYNMTHQAYQKYREDPVIRQFAYVVEQMFDKHGSAAIVNQAELTEIYNKLARISEHNHFRDALGMFLLDSPMQQKTASSEDFVRMNRVDAEDSQLSTDDYIDSALVNSLAKAFGGDVAEERGYNAKAAAIGKEHVELELMTMGYKKPRVEVLGGDASVLVYAAHVDTEHGIVTVAIPLELSSGKVLLPSAFVADDHLEELTAQKFQYFVDKKAFNKDFSVPKTATVIAAVKTMTGMHKVASADEFAAELANIDRYDERGEQVHLSNPGLFSDRQNHPEPKSYIDTTPKVQMPQELAHLARDFEDDVLEAASQFGRSAVQAGKQLVFTELLTAGFKNAQVRFGSESGDSVIYMAAIHTPTGPVEIEVPVEMKVLANDQYVPLAPSCFGHDGVIEDFTPNKLQHFASHRPSPSTTEMVYSSAHAYMTVPEMRDTIVKAAMAGDYNAAEMVMGTVQERFGEDVYKNVVADYHHILMHKQASVSAAPKCCSRMIPAGQGSIEPRCGCFGVPMSKVIVASDGQCRLRSHVEKEALNPLDEGGAAISTSKLFLS